jgi:shikimate kinase
MNLVFNGFMGTGKSKTGKVVSERLKRAFFDTDELIEKKLGFSINDIFSKFGEAYFRRLEADIVKEVSESDSAVISCGGGIVLNAENIVFLRKKGVIINLCASPETIYERAKCEDKRPLLKCKEPLSEIKKLLNVRKNAYMDCDFVFNTDGLTPERIADKILNNESIKRLLF